MIATRRLQRSFADGFIAEEVADLWEPWMRQADQVLEDDGLLTLIQQELSRRIKKSKTRGRPGTPAEIVLRMLVLKHMRDYSFEQLSRQRLKQRIVRILIREIVAEVDEKSREVVLVIHWAGGRHSEIRVKKSETGRSRRCTDPETIEVLRQMAGMFTDQQIAATLNRLRLRTGVGNSWNVMRVRSARSYYQLPAFAQNDPPREVTLQEAARRLNVSQSTVRRMIEEKILPARQVVLCAPWQIPVGALESEAIRQEATNIQNRVRVPQSQSVEGQESIFSEK